jgi:hypothetical protein
MSPEDFITKIVEPNVAEAMARPNDERLVFNACAAVEGLASSIYWLRRDAGDQVPDRDSKFKEHLGSVSEAFDIIHAVAESQKQFKLTFSSSAGRPVTSAAQVVPRTHGWDKSLWDEMLWDVEEAVAIEYDSQIRTIAPIATKALEFLKNELARANAPSISS